MTSSEAHPEPAPDGGAQLVRTWSPDGEAKGNVVLVHGLGEHSGRYGRTGEIFSGAGYAVRAFDLFGHGATSGRRGDIERWALYLDQVQGHIEAIRQSSGLTLILLGHSMGGQIALDYALSERPQPDLLVLSAPLLGGGKPWQRVVGPVVGRIFPKLMLPVSVTGDQLSRDPAVGEAYFADPLVLTKASAGLGARIFAGWKRIPAALDHLRVSTLVVHGGADTVVPPQATAGLTANPLVERRLFPPLRHESFNEPEGPQVLAEIIEWIEAHA
jgi:alpha-beta hydrolase superfamily lysophospholipase